MCLGVPGEKIRAKECLEKAHKLAPDDPRIVYELLQLYKNLDVSPSERLAFLERIKRRLLRGTTAPSTGSPCMYSRAS